LYYHNLRTRAGVRGCIIIEQSTIYVLTVAAAAADTVFSWPTAGLAAFGTRSSRMPLAITIKTDNWCTNIPPAMWTWPLKTPASSPATVALRVGNAPAETLVGRRVGRLAFAVYGSAGYRARWPETDLAQHDWIGFDSEHEALVRRIGRFLPEAKPTLRTNSVAAALFAAKAGLGLAPLPCGLADLEADLVRIAPLPEDFTLDLWLLTHEDLRQTARIRAFLDFLAEAVANEAPLLEGRNCGDGDSLSHDDPSKCEDRASSSRR